MKKSLRLIVLLTLGFAGMEANAQLPDGSVAPNFTFTDMNGQTQDLYTYLNAGKSVVIDVSATWCGPCWSYHNSGNLENFYLQQGPSGTNKAMVIFIEGDGATTNADMNGTGSNTQGNWVQGTPYPMCNPASAQINPFNSAYQIGYFPTMYLICAADKKTKKVDQYTTAQLVTALNGCPPVNPTVALDAGIASIIAPSGTACGSTITPIITLQNYGINTLTSCTINYKIDNNPNQTFNWTGSLASNATANITLSSLTTTAGTHSFTCNTSAPNAGTDGNAANDLKATTFTATTASGNLPIMEGMEAAFPAAGWTINNPDNATTWAKKSGVGKTGTASAYVDNFNYQANGEIDEIVLPPLNLQFFGTPTLKFQVAYQLFTDPATSPNYSDTLKVMVSSDCGATWQTSYKKFGTALTTITPAFSSNEFIPGSNDWRLETISLPNSPSVIVKFVNVTQYENQLYIDDINITGIGNNSVNEVNIDGFVSVYPSPTTGEVNVSVSLLDLNDINVRITNILGESVAESVSNSTKMKFDLSEQPDGMYFIELKSGNARSLKKIMLNK